MNVLVSIAASECAPGAGKRVGSGQRSRGYQEIATGSLAAYPTAGHRHGLYPPPILVYAHDRQALTQARFAGTLLGLAL